MNTIKAIENFINNKSDELIDFVKNKEVDINFVVEALLTKETKIVPLEKIKKIIDIDKDNEEIRKNPNLLKWACSHNNEDAVSFFSKFCKNNDIPGSINACIINKKEKNLLKLISLGYKKDIGTDWSLNRAVSRMQAYSNTIITNIILKETNKSKISQDTKNRIKNDKHLLSQAIFDNSFELIDFVLDEGLIDKKAVTFTNFPIISLLNANGFDKNLEKNLYYKVLTNKHVKENLTKEIMGEIFLVACEYNSIELIDFLLKSKKIINANISYNEYECIKTCLISKNKLVIDHLVKNYNLDLNSESSKGIKSFISYYDNQEDFEFLIDLIEKYKIKKPLMEIKEEGKKKIVDSIFDYFELKNKTKQNKITNKIKI